METLKWLKELQVFINNFLKNIITDKELRLKYLDNKAMAVWSKAFTHQTFSYEDNYEDLEYQGDVILKSVFPKYLMKRFPNFRRNYLNELYTLNMSKIKQSHLATKMNLAKYIRVRDIQITTEILEDVFESFFGALDFISDHIAYGLGYSVCYNTIEYIYKDEEIDLSKIHGSEKTQVIQIFSRFGISNLDEEEITSYGVTVTINASEELTQLGVINPLSEVSSVNYKTAEENAIQKAFQALKDYKLIEVSKVEKRKYGNEFIFIVRLTEKHIKFLKDFGIQMNLNDNIIGIGKGTSKSIAENNAYINALKTLKSYGIDSSWAESKKQESYLKNLPDDIRSKLDEKIKKDGYKSVIFYTPKKSLTSDQNVHQMVGIKPDNKKDILSTFVIKGKETLYNWVLELVMKYLNQ